MENKEIINEDFSKDIFTQLSREEFEDLFYTIPYENIIRYLNNTPKDIPSIFRSFRVESIPKNKIVDSFYKGISNQNTNLARYLESCIKKMIITTRNKCKERGLDIKDSFKDDKKLKDLVEVLLETEFCNHIELFFKMNNIELTVENRQKINKIIDYKKLYKEVYKQVINDIKHSNKSRIETELAEKRTKIEELESEVKDLKRERIEIGKEKANSIDQLKNEIEKIKVSNDFMLRSIQKKHSKNIKSYTEKIKKISYELECKTEKCEELEKTCFCLREEKEKTNLLLQDKKEGFRKDFEEKLKVENYNLGIQIEEKNKKLQAISIELEELGLEIGKLKDERDYYQSNINDLEKGLLNQINIINEFWGSKFQNDDYKETSIYYSENEIELEIDKFESTNDFEFFTDDLEDNLQVVGIDAKYKGNLAKYISAILTIKRPILLIGYNVRQVANAISCLINGEAAEILNLIPGKTTCDSLIRHVRNTERKVILIENAIEDLKESVYLPLIKEVNNKIILFSMEDSDNIQILSRSIFNYLIPIDIEHVIGNKENGNLITSILNSNLLNVDISNLKKDYKEDIYFIQNIRGINKVVKQNIGQLIHAMCEIYSINEELAMNIIIQYTIYPICKYNNNVNMLIECCRGNKNNTPAFDEFIQELSKDYEVYE